MQTEYRKGAVDLTDLAIGIVTLGIVVSIGAVILINAGNSQVTSLGTYIVSNEAVTVSGLETGTTLSTTWGQSVTTCNNNSQEGDVINAANYSVSIDSSNGLITMTNLTSEYIDKPWSCNYSVYNVSDPRFSLYQKAAMGLGEYGNWFKILVIVGAAAVVLALIFMAFGSRGSSSSGGAVGGSW